MMDNRLQDSSRASTSDAVIMYNVQKTKPLLSVAMSGVLVTIHFVYNGTWKNITLRNRWMTLMDTRSGTLSITGWMGVQKSGYSDVFKEMVRRLENTREQLACPDVFKDTAARNGYGNLSVNCCPQCGTSS